MKQLKYFFIVILLLLAHTNNSYAFTSKNVYIFYNQTKDNISEEISYHIQDKRHKLYKSDIEKGFFYFQPRNFNTYTEGNYVLIGLKEVGDDTFLYAQANWGADLYKLKLIDYLKEQDFIFQEIKDKQIKAELDELANNFISQSQSSSIAKNKEEIKPKSKGNDIYAKYSNKELIKLALDILKNSKYSYITDSISGKNKSGKPIIIKFRDLSAYGMKYRSWDALGWMKNGRLYIDINQKHKNAPPEAIASLIARLEVHQDGTDSISEEAFATYQELNVWKELSQKNPKAALVKCDLTKRENDLLKRFNNKKDTKQAIREFISAHPAYKNLPKNSSGFGAPNKSNTYLEKSDVKSDISNIYIKNLESKIKSTWNPPKQSKTKSAKVLFEIDKKGNLINTKIIKSSKNRKFDNEAIETIEKIAPFKPLPKKYNKETISIEFTFDYNLYKLQK